MAYLLLHHYWQRQQEHLEDQFQQLDVQEGCQHWQQQQLLHEVSGIFHGLVGHFQEGGESVGVQSALGGIRKEVDEHMDFLETEHVEHKVDHAHQRKMVRFWKCSKVSLHSSKTYTPGDTEQEIDQTYYQWTKMKNLPGWWVKKVWHSYDGWLLVANKEEYTLLIPDKLIPVDQRNLVEETLGSEGSLDNQRQSLGSTMARKAHHQCCRGLHSIHVPPNLEVGGRWLKHQGCPKGHP